MILLRIAMGLTVGSTLAVVGYAVGWILALSVPEGIPRIPILIVMTSVGATAGTFIAWHFMHWCRIMQSSRYSIGS